MYKDFVNVTPESGGAGTTPIAVAADENEGAARSTSLNIAGGGVTRTVSITQKKMLVENQIEVKYWLDAATSGAGKSIYLEAYANNDVASNLKINFSIDQQGPTGEWETNEGYQYWRNTTPNVYLNEYPTVKTVQMRVGIGDNTDPEPIHTYLAQFTVNIILSPRP